MDLIAQIFAFLLKVVSWLLGQMTGTDKQTLILIVACVVALWLGY